MLRMIMAFSNELPEFHALLPYYGSVCSFNENLSNYQRIICLRSGLVAQRVAPLVYISQMGDQISFRHYLLVCCNCLARTLKTCNQTCNWPKLPIIDNFFVCPGFWSCVLCCLGSAPSPPDQNKWLEDRWFQFRFSI